MQPNIVGKLVNTMLTAGLIALVVPAQVRASEIKVAVAANFKQVANTLAREFEQNEVNLERHRVTIISASTGKLFAQIENGAPYDLFLSADQKHPNLLAHRGLGLSASLADYAIGQLVLMEKITTVTQNRSDNPGGIDELNGPDSPYRQAPKYNPRSTADTIAQVLVSNNISRIVLANPRHAPYGQAAEIFLKQLPFQQAIQSKLVFSENVGQAFQLLISGAVDAGFVPLSYYRHYFATKSEPNSDNVMDESLNENRDENRNFLHSGFRHYQLNHLMKPEKSPLIQSLISLTKGADPDAVALFRDFILSPQGRAIIQSAGYQLPPMVKNSSATEQMANQQIATEQIAKNQVAQ